MTCCGSFELLYESLDDISWSFDEDFAIFLFMLLNMPICNWFYNIVIMRMRMRNEKYKDFTILHEGWATHRSNILYEGLATCHGNYIWRLCHTL